MNGEAMVGLIGAAAIVLMIALSFWAKTPIGAEPAIGRSGLTSPAADGAPVTAARTSGNAAPPLEAQPPPSTGGMAGPLTPGSLEQIGGGWDEFFRDHKTCREARRDGKPGACSECAPAQLLEGR